MKLFGFYCGLLDFGLIEAQNCWAYQIEEAWDDPSVYASIEAVYVPGEYIDLAEWKIFKLCLSSFEKWRSNSIEIMLFNSPIY